MRAGPTGPSGPLALSEVEGTLQLEGTTLVVPGRIALSGTEGTRYSAAVVERVRQVARVGAWPAGPGVGTGDSGAIAEGTFVRVQVREAATGDGRLEAVYKVFGCSAAIASASLVAEWIEQERTLRAEDVMAALELPPERAHAAGMAVDAARKAVTSLGRREPVADSREPVGESRKS